MKILVRSGPDCSLASRSVCWDFSSSASLLIGAMRRTLPSRVLPCLLILRMMSRNWSQGMSSKLTGDRAPDFGVEDDVQAGEFSPSQRTTSRRSASLETGADQIRPEYFSCGVVDRPGLALFVLGGGGFFSPAWAWPGRALALAAAAGDLRRLRRFDFGGAGIRRRSGRSWARAPELVRRVSPPVGRRDGRGPGGRRGTTQTSPWREIVSPEAGWSSGTARPR